MVIGIDGSRAFIKNRTGIEEYSYQVIKSLRDKLGDHQVVLYVRKNQSIDFEVPKNWKICVIGWSRFWTQLGLSLELFLHPIGVLFVPAHTVPWIHPKKTIVTIHGLEYEIVPRAYSAWERFYMRWSIKSACHWADNIVSVSKNTKHDLMRLYGISGDKIRVIYEGYDLEKAKIRNSNSEMNRKLQKLKPFLLFIGRLEERKNIIGIIEAFEILKEKHRLPHKLVLAGKGGYGFSNIQAVIKNSKYENDITQLGFVRDVDKFKLISHADIFMFPTFYEGFGIPILEAQSVGVPVITSNISSMPEVAGESALLADPRESWHIAEQAFSLMMDKKQRNDMIARGYENVKQFSWDKCSQSLADLITKNESTK